MSDEMNYGPDSESVNLEGAYDADAESLVMDLSSIDPDAEPELVPAGVYDCIVDDVTYGLSQASGSPMITAKLKIIEGPYANRLLWHFMVLNQDFGKAALVRFISRVCPPGSVDLSTFNAAQFANNQVVVGMPCKVKAKVTMRKGKRGTNVQDILPAGEVSFLDGPR